MNVNILLSDEKIIKEKLDCTAASFFKKIKKIFAKTLADEGFLPPSTVGADISLTALPSEEMAAINLRYRGIDSATDVLSFPLWEDGDEFVPPEDWEIVTLGDIVICPEVIERNAAQNGKKFEEELVLVLSHGLLHLIGLDHDGESAKERMWKLQERMVNDFFSEDGEKDV